MFLACLLIDSIFNSSFIYISIYLLSFNCLTKKAILQLHKSAQEISQNLTIYTKHFCWVRSTSSFFQLPAGSFIKFLVDAMCFKELSAVHGYYFPFSIQLCYRAYNSMNWRRCSYNRSNRWPELLQMNNTTFLFLATTMLKSLYLQRSFWSNYPAIHL